LALTKRESEILAGYVSSLLPAMNLAQWSVRIQVDPLEEDSGAVARIIPAFGQHRATLILCYGFTDMSLADQRRYLVHELTHLHLQRVYRAFTAVQQVASPGEFAIMDTAIKEAIETATDDLASAWSESLPLISDPPKAHDQESGSC